MESFVHLRKGRTPRRLHADLDGWLSQWSFDDARGDAVSCGPDQRDALRAAVTIVTDWLVRHDSADKE